MFPRSSDSQLTHKGRTIRHLGSLTPLIQTRHDSWQSCVTQPASNLYDSRANIRTYARDYKSKSAKITNRLKALARLSSSYQKKSSSFKQSIPIKEGHQKPIREKPPIIASLMRVAPLKL
jgi:flagellar capping protein FliD